MAFQKLPRTVLPDLYRLRVHPNFETLTFRGHLEIDSRVTSPTSFVRMNCLDLEISSATITQDGETIRTDCLFNEGDQTVDLCAPRELNHGEANIKLDFSGPISPKMAGFYQIKYKLNGKDLVGASTQFEPIDARRAFPCFDEPNFKARFQVSVSARPDQTVISNMQEESVDELPNGHLLHVFKQTPLMSTYLLAYTVGHFGHLEGKSARGVDIRVYTPLGRENEGKFALDVAQKCLSFYEDFFSIDYPLPKLDLVSIPDFSAGAMENWGLVTFRETTLLVNEEESSTKTKRFVTLVVAHELAHMWFGNLVTMNWWTDLWLNEGFATFMEYFCSGRCFPACKFATTFLCMEFMPSLVTDTLSNSHPVEVPIDDPRKIDEIFDEISYSKGSSIIAMMFYFMGEKKFRESLHSYLTRFSYKNTDTKDLVQSFADTPYDASKIINSFTLQCGFPFIKVTSVPDDGLVVLQLKQSRFRTMSALGRPDDTLWSIPVGYISESSPNDVKYFVLDENFCEFSTNIGESEWIKLNAGVHGFFRVLYSSQLFSRILKAAPELSLNDQISLLDDAYALGLSGYSDLDMAFQLTNTLKDNYSTYIWGVIAQAIAEISRIVSGSEAEDSFKLFVRGLLTSGVFDFVGWDAKQGEDEETPLLRSIVFGLMARYGDDSFHSKCRELFDRIINESYKPDPNTLLAVYQSVLRNGTLKDLSDILTFYDGVERAESKSVIIMSLGSLSCPGAVHAIFEFLKSGKIRAQDFVYLMRGLKTSPYNSEEFWSLYKENFSFLEDSVQVSSLAGSVKCVSYYMHTDEQLIDFREFFGGKNIVGIDRTVKQCDEEITELGLRVCRHVTHIKNCLSS